MKIMAAAPPWPFGLFLAAPSKWRTCRGLLVEEGVMVGVGRVIVLRGYCVWGVVVSRGVVTVVVGRGRAK
jgi:hypothetical protein